MDEVQIARRRMKSDRNATHPKYRLDEIELGELAGWLTNTEAARYLNRSFSWIKTLAREGELKAVHTAGGYLFDPEDLERIKHERGYHDHHPSHGVNPNLKSKRERGRKSGEPGRSRA